MVWLGGSTAFLSSHFPVFSRNGDPAVDQSFGEFRFGVAMFCLWCRDVLFSGRQVLITLCDFGPRCTLGEIIRRIFQLLMRGRIAAPNLGSLFFVDFIVFAADRFLWYMMWFSARGFAVPHYAADYFVFVFLDSLGDLEKSPFWESCGVADIKLGSSMTWLHWRRYVSSSNVRTYHDGIYAQRSTGTTQNGNKTTWQHSIMFQPQLRPKYIL